MKPRKSPIFGAGTGDTISGIFNRNPENPEIAVYSFQSYIIKPRGTPSPAPKLGDGVGTGEAFQNLRGRGTVQQNGVMGPLSGEFSKIFQNVLQITPRPE